MTGPTFPAGRTLAGWWRQLAGWQPRALWVGQLVVHAVDVLVERCEQAPLAPLDLLVLKALILVPGSAAEQLNERLQVGRQFLAQLLLGLQQRGLAHDVPGGWAAAPLGHAAIENGAYPSSTHERQLFYFRAGPTPAHFLSLDQPNLQPLAAGDNWHFDPAWLHACLAQAVEWKQRFGFPLEVTKIVGPAISSDLPAWQRVILARLLHTGLALVLVGPETGERLLAFTALESGQLQTQRPLFAVPAEGQAVFPEVAAAPSSEDWRQAWLGWCRQRNLADVAGEAVGFSVAGGLLNVQAQGRLRDRLRSLRGDVLQEEGWLLAGTAPIRQAARVNVVASD